MLELFLNILKDYGYEEVFSPGIKEGQRYFKEPSDSMNVIWIEKGLYYCFPKNNLINNILKDYIKETRKLKLKRLNESRN